MLDEQNWIIDTLYHSLGIELAWLYGSRAINKQSANSDYDVAVALRPGVTGNFEIVDEIQYKLACGLDVAISMVDINRIPVPLAYNIVAQGKVLLCRSDFRLRLEQQRIWSLWEEYKYQYERHRYAIREQLDQHIEGLNELSEQLKQRPLSFNERNATERGLQVLVEIAFGCSKRYLQLRDKPIPAEARAAIERVYEILALSTPDIAVMRGAVGMRNAIIHDYLNLDWQRVEPVVKARRYREIKTYAMQVSAQLLEFPGGDDCHCWFRGCSS